MNLERIRPVAKKELRQIFRDKRTLAMLLGLPAFLLIMYGYALNFDVKRLALAILDQEKSQRSREFCNRFLHTEYFNLKYSLESLREVDELMAEGRIQLALVIPPDFSRSLLAGRTSTFQVIIDGEETVMAGTALGYVNAIAQSYSNGLAAEAASRAGRRGPVLPLDLRPRVWFNPDLRSALFLIPGLMAFILMITVVISTSFSVVREIERGSIEQLIVSPVRPLELIIGKTIPYVLISLASTHTVLFFGRFLFGVSIRGSYGWLLLGIVLFLICGLGIGLLISTVARTQQVAFMIAVISTLLPTFILSGFVFPIRNMPSPVRAVTYLIPARYFLVVLRGVMLKAVGPAAFGRELIFLAGFALLTIALSSLRLAKTLRKG